MTGKNLPYVIVTAFSLALSVVYCPLLDIFFDDKEIFKYTGFLLKEGAVPYRDFFDHKPPLIFFFNYLHALFGGWFFWLLDTALVLYCSIQFLQLNIKHKVVFPFFLPLLFNFLIRDHHISSGVGLTREYTTIFILLFFCTMMHRKRFHFFFMGLLTALVFFTQQDQVVILIPFIIYALWNRLNNKKDLVPNTAQLVSGFLTVMVPLSLYFLANNSLTYFWQDAFLFNFQWYTSPDEKPGLLTTLVGITKKIHEFGFDIIFIFLLVAALVSMYMGSKTTWLLFASLCAVPLSFISELLSRKISIGDANVYYYLLPIAATVPIALFVIFAFTKKAVFRDKRHQFVYGCLLLGIVVLNMLRYVANHHKYPQDYINQSEEIKYLDKNPPKDYQLYVFNYSSYIYAYNKYQVKAPSRWLYHYFWTWYEHWDADGKILYSILGDLKRHRTTYILSFDSLNHFKNRNNNDVWRRFLDSSYMQIKPLNLWRLKQ